MQPCLLLSYFPHLIPMLFFSNSYKILGPLCKVLFPSHLKKKLAMYSMGQVNYISSVTLYLEAGFYFKEKGSEESRSLTMWSQKLAAINIP